MDRESNDVKDSMIIEEESCWNICFEDMYHDFMARSFYKNVEYYLAELYKIQMSHKDDKGRTPLHYLCLDGRILVLKLMLVDHHIATDLNATDRFGRTPLHYACRQGHEECVVALLKLGADVTLKDHHGWTAIDAARFNGRKELLDALRGNLRPGLMSPGGASPSKLISPSKPIKAEDLRMDLPPEETKFGVQLDDVFIPSPALQRLRTAGSKIIGQVKSTSSSSSFQGIVNAALDKKNSAAAAAAAAAAVPPAPAPATPQSATTARFAALAAKARQTPSATKKQMPALSISINDDEMATP